MIESLYRKWLTSFGGVYTEIKGYISDPLERELANKGVTLITGVKKHETQSDETLEPLDTPETIYYRNRF
ncbi:Mobile element protein [Candidatus Enterovibrio escicola]|uniref:Mobile element protein n=1 Tax=Candidatus Enterovibrio escicola TaxID=1927127 RepID=A0A2A5T2J7_9GAMM|nr:transposase [Candidatus Enterovibrio escacola]PCS22382.1 Mobile element protein [Candidatus Enterovibrio escacola]